MTVYASTDCTGTSQSEDMVLGGCLSGDYYNYKTTSNGITSSSTSPSSSPVSSPTKSPATSPSTSPSTVRSSSTLTGYFSSGIYSDLSCKTPVIVQFSALNACYPTGESNTYESVTAYTTYVITSTYSDSLCKVFVSREVQSFSDGACVYGRKASVSTTSTLTTDVAAITQR